MSQEKKFNGHGAMKQPFAIPFPARQQVERRLRMVAAQEDIIDSLRHRYEERAQKLSREAYGSGYHVGEREGYRMGWWYGLVCGAVVGGLLVAVAVKAGVALGL